MISEHRTSSIGEWNQFRLAVAMKGADWAFRVPALRDWLLEKLLDRLETAYDQTEYNDEQLMHVHWLGRTLRPFLQRLVSERPAAARAMLRFLITWSQDMYHRDAAQIAGQATPCTAVIEPTDRCNLHCPGCYAKSSSDGFDLPFEQLVQIVRQVIDMGVSLITISGGEPFLREKSDRTITRLGEMFPNQGFLIYTNGTLIDDVTAERMGRVGNIFPAISVEGFEHQTDYRRGKGVYELNRRVRQRLAEHGVMVGFSATITRENAEAIASDAFIDLRIAEGDLFGWFFLLQPIGRSPRADLMVTADQRAALRDAVYRWRDQRRPIFLGDFWNDGPLVGGCIAGGRYYFHIYANGDISPCVFSPIAAGNIFDIIAGRSEYASLNDFVQRHPLFVGFREKQKLIHDRAAPCVLIDHPELFRQLCSEVGYRPAKNMPADYLEGPIAEAIDTIAETWKAKIPHLSPLPAEIERANRQSQKVASVV
ncbi:MAG: radical SAM/SPASM domain-containing protein [Planctomycetota bacterium]|nr:radical SAM/SPASM domain-containing protein [Planctomycetota bacterium]